MKNKYTAVIKQDGDWWVDWIAEVPGVNCQEPTHESLLKSLKVTLSEAIAFNRQDAFSAAAPTSGKNLFLYETDSWAEIKFKPPWFSRKYCKKIMVSNKTNALDAPSSGQ